MTGDFKFRTEYTPARGVFPQLDYNRRVLLLGSCFTDNIGERLSHTGWDADVNPCGVLYNPMSIASALRMGMADCYRPALQRHPVSGVSFCFDFSTRFSAPDAADAERIMLEAVNRLRGSLLSAQTVFVTFGTSYVFELADTGCVVANCHKLPASLFRRRCMDIDEMYAVWSELITDVRKLNPHLKFIFTVSPVRHLADGFEGNARSKSRLLLLCEQLCRLPECYYFPAFEIVTDDLRDYRFYAEDMAHPSSFAADYVFRKFADAFVSPEVIPLMVSAEKAYRASLHRPLAAGSKK